MSWKLWSNCNEDSVISTAFSGSLTLFFFPPVAIQFWGDNSYLLEAELQHYRYPGGRKNHSVWQKSWSRSVKYSQHFRSRLSADTARQQATNQNKSSSPRLRKQLQRNSLTKRLPVKCLSYIPAANACLGFYEQSIDFPHLTSSQK